MQGAELVAVGWIGKDLTTVLKFKMCEISRNGHNNFLSPRSPFIPNDHVYVISYQESFEKKKGQQFNIVLETSLKTPTKN